MLHAALMMSFLQAKDLMKSETEPATGLVSVVADVVVIHLHPRQCAAHFVTWELSWTSLSRCSAPVTKTSTCLSELGLKWPETGVTF